MSRPDTPLEIDPERIDKDVIAFMFPNDPDSMKHHSAKRGSLVSQAEERVHITPSPNNENEVYKCMAYMHSQKPLNRRELGRVSWAFLHTVAAYFPQTPSIQDQREMKEFVHNFSRFYPYEPDRLDDETLNIIQVDSRDNFQYSLCKVHNTVNEKIGKPIFDCDLVSQRWKTGLSELCGYVQQGDKHPSTE